jgi:hypothetical protein
MSRSTRPGSAACCRPRAAAEAIEVLDDARTGGGYISTIRTSSPQDIAAQRQRLAAGLDDPTANNYARRKRLVDIYDEQRAHHFTELGKDPGKYVAAYSPDVAAAYGAAFPNGDRRSRPTRTPRCFRATRTPRWPSRPGSACRRASARILPEAQAANDAEQITRIDPAKTDPAQTDGAISRIASAPGRAPTTTGRRSSASSSGPSSRVPIRCIATHGPPGPEGRRRRSVAQRSPLSRTRAAWRRSRPARARQIKDIDKEIVSQLEDFRHSTGPPMARGSTTSGSRRRPRRWPTTTPTAARTRPRPRSTRSMASSMPSTISGQFRQLHGARPEGRRQEHGERHAAPPPTASCRRSQPTRINCRRSPDRHTCGPNSARRMWLENIAGRRLGQQWRRHRHRADGATAAGRPGPGAAVGRLARGAALQGRVQPIVGTAAEPPIEGPAIRHWREFGRPAPGGGLAPAPVPVPGMMEPAALQ